VSLDESFFIQPADMAIAFFASVEELMNPSLKEKPMAVGVS
jgi:nucleotidyltransferase/DNA polymerase involved in DNA repair